MRHLFVYILSLLSIVCHAQERTSYVSIEKRKEIIKNLLENQAMADNKYLYDSLSGNSQIIKIIMANIAVKDKNSASFDLKLINHLRLQEEEDYLIYNITTRKEHRIIGILSKEDNQVYPATSIDPSVLDDISRDFDLNKITLLGLNGIPGVCVLYNNEIWIIKGNTKTDLNTYIKENYTLSEFRNVFLFSTESN